MWHLGGIKIDPGLKSDQEQPVVLFCWLVHRRTGLRSHGQVQSGTIDAKDAKCRDLTLGAGSMIALSLISDVENRMLEGRTTA